MQEYIFRDFPPKNCADNFNWHPCFNEEYKHFPRGGKSDILQNVVV